MVFRGLDNVIQTLGILLDFRKAKNTCPGARVFLRFSSLAKSRVFGSRYPNSCYK